MRIYRDFSLKNHNGLKLPVKCDYFCDVKSSSDLTSLILNKRYTKLPRFILGGGCNTFFTKDFKGLVIKNSLSQIKILSLTSSHVFLEIGAGVNWQALVAYCVENGWGGVENMALIPGTVGGACVGNIAAYGQNFSDVFVSLEAVSLDSGKFSTFSRKKMKFEYRGSAFKNNDASTTGLMITKITLKLSKKPKLSTGYWTYKHGVLKDVLEQLCVRPYTVKDVYDAVIYMRNQKFGDLAKYGCLGSFFQNALVTKEKLAEIQKILPNVQYYPAEKLEYVKNTGEITDDKVKVASGQLIDDVLHLKGKWFNDVGIYEKHALIVVTREGANPADLLAMTEKLRADFKTTLGVDLVYEVVLV